MEENREVSNYNKENVKKKEGFLLIGNYFDYKALVALLMLIAFGFVMIYSSSAKSIGESKTDFNDIFVKQVICFGLGIVAFIGVSFVRYQKLNKRFIINLAYAIAVVAMVACFFQEARNGSKRWLNIFGFTLQPSEFAKIVIIVMSTFYYVDHDDEIDTPVGLLKWSWKQVLLIGLVGISSMTSAMVCIGVLIVIYLLAIRQFKQWMGFAIIIVVVGAVLGLLIIGPYRIARINVMFHPGDSIDGYQILQSLYAVGTGGLFGRGLGQSLQKYYLPEANNDMIFAIIVEELGIVGALVLISLYAVLIYRLRFIAFAAPDKSGSLIVMGISAHILLQAIANIYVACNLMPNTGVTMPFISAGGSSIIFLLMEMGLAFAVGRQIKPR